MKPSDVCSRIQAKLSALLERLRIRDAGLKDRATCTSHEPKGRRSNISGKALP